MRVLFDENIDIDRLQEIRNIIRDSTSVEILTEKLEKIYGEKMNDVLAKLKMLNMNFGRGKNLKNITNYAKYYATEEDKKQVVEFSRKLRRKFYELY